MDEQQRKEYEIERANELSDIQKIVETPEGMRFFQRFFEKGLLFTTTFTGNSHSYFNEGRRSLALNIFGDVCEAAPERVPPLILNIQKGAKS